MILQFKLRLKLLVWELLSAVVINTFTLYFSQFISG